MIDGREYESVLLESEGYKDRVMPRRLAQKWVAAEKRRGIVWRIKEIKP